MATSLTPLSLTRALLAFDTTNPPGREKACSEYLGRLLENAGFETHLDQFAEERTNLVARMRGSGSRTPICFTGHLDTIPLGASPRTRDPFKGEVEGDKIYGRGASDMKGGLAAMILAGLHLAELSRGKADFTLIFTGGEETGCQGAYHLAGLESLLGKAGALVVGEPTSNFPFIGHKGALWLNARATGVAAHGSMPEQGINAIYKAADALMKLRKFDFQVPPHALLGSPTLNVGTIKGGTSINAVPDEVFMGIDIRTIPGQTNREIRAKIQSELGEDWELECLVDVGGVATDARHAWVVEVFEIAEAISNETPVPRGATYFTDASVLTPALGNPPTIILGPGEPHMAHKTDEFCRISSIEKAAQAYFEIAKTWCGF